MKTINIIEKESKSKTFLYTVGEIRHVGQIISHGTKNKCEFSQIWIGSLSKEAIRIKFGNNGLFIVRFDVENMKSIEITHAPSINNDAEAVLHEGILTLITKFE